MDADFSAAGVRELSFGNTFPVKVRERRGEELRTENGGGWIGWALFRAGSHKPASTPALRPETDLRSANGLRELMQAPDSRETVTPR